IVQMPGVVRCFQCDRVGRPEVLADPRLKVFEVHPSRGHNDLLLAIDGGNRRIPSMHIQTDVTSRLPTSPRCLQMPLLSLRRFLTTEIGVPLRATGVTHRYELPVSLPGSHLS